MGNKNEFEKQATVLEGMDDIMAIAYSEKLNKSKDEILSLMDKETWFIGEQQLLENNIISEIIDDTFNEIPQEDVSQEAYDGIAACSKYFNEHKDLIISDIQKIAALAVKINNKEDKISMTLNELLKSNPDAKAEYDNALISAKAEGENVSLLNERERIAKILKTGGLSEASIKAIDNGISAGAFAEIELMRLKELEKAKEVFSFSAFSVPQTPKEQDRTANISAIDPKIKEKVSNFIACVGV
jgi:hypothetical protein